MSHSGYYHDEHFKSTSEDENDTIYNTTEDKNQLPKYLTDTPATRDALSDFYVEQELSEEGP
eukprot:3326223-Ditylum_brightwellii.AAC.1